MKNTLFVLLDGAEDHPNPLMDGKKPLEIAEMPFLKSKAKHQFKTTGRGYTQLFLNEFFTGHPPEIPRAVLEAIGLGMSIKDTKRTAYRLSPAMIEDGQVKWSYHPESFCDSLMECMKSHMDILDPYDPELRFFIKGRAVLTMACDQFPTGGPEAPVDGPFKEIPGPMGEFVEAVRKDMGGIVDHPWGCGKLENQYPPFKELPELTAISDSPTSLGVCASLGYKIKLIDDLDERFPAAREALEHGNVFLHVDEVDEYSHEQDPFKKKRVLEHTDKMMAEYFPDVENIVYFVDHGTSCVTGKHILMDVPLWTSIETGIPDGSMIPLKDVVPTLIRSIR